MIVQAVPSVYKTASLSAAKANSVSQLFFVINDMHRHTHADDNESKVIF